MAQGYPFLKNRLLKTVFGMAAGVLMAVGVAHAQDSAPESNYDAANFRPIAAPTNPAAYRHPMATTSDEDVGVLLVLALDASGSMSTEEWDIQRRATAAALMSTQVRTTIRCKSGDRSIAIAVVDFSSQPELRIPWFDLRANSCNEPDPEFDHRIEMLATQIARLERSSSGSTHIGNMLQYVLQVYVNAPWQPTERRVLDVSGDGTNNGGVPIEPGRQALMDFGVTINGIAIVNDDRNLDEYFRRELVSNAFRRSPDGRTTSTQGHVWVVARNMSASGNSAMTLFTFAQDVENALKQKISMEVAGIYDQRTLDRVLAAAQQTGQDFQPAGEQPQPERRTAGEVMQVWRGSSSPRLAP